LVEEYGGTKKSASWSGTDPVGVGGVEAEVTAFVKALEPTLDDKVLALVATREGNPEVSLAGVHSGGLVSNDEVLDTCEKEFGESM
jgi:hypothetical protein